MSTDATETAAGAATPTPSTLSSAKESTASPPAAAPAAATATTEATDASPVPATAPAEGGDSTKKESTGGDDADAAALAAATKKLQLNPDVPEFTPSSPARGSPVRSTAFPASWAPPAAVVRNSGLRPPPGVVAASQQGSNNGSPSSYSAAAANATPPGAASKKPRRRKRRGRKRGASVDADPRLVKIMGMTGAMDHALLKSLLVQLFGPVASFSFGDQGNGKKLGLVTFASVESAQRAVRSGSINHNGTALKIVRASVANNAPSNVVRLSGLPLSTTEESLAKILAKHGARASSSDMQTANGAFTGVVLCRYCSTDAAARAVSQLSNSVVEGHTLKAVYNVAGGDAGTGGGAGGNNAVASAAPTPPHAQRPRGNSRDGSRLIMVPAVPHTGRVRSRSRGFSEDWSSRRSAEKFRKGSFSGSVVSEASEGSQSSWRKRRSRSLSNAGAAPVHYAAGPDGSVGFERVRRGRSRSVAAAPPAMEE